MLVLAAGKQEAEDLQQSSRRAVSEYSSASEQQGAGQQISSRHQDRETETDSNLLLSQEGLEAAPNTKLGADFKLQQQQRGHGEQPGQAAVPSGGHARGLHQVGDTEIIQAMWLLRDYTSVSLYSLKTFEKQCSE